MSNDAIEDAGEVDAAIADVALQSEAGDAEAGPVEFPRTLPSVRAACAPGAWCWEQPTRYGAGYTDVLVESPSSVWLAGSEPGTLVHFDGSEWALVRLPTNVVLSRFTHEPAGLTYAWGSRLELDGRFTGALFRRAADGWQLVTLPADEAPLVVVDSAEARTFVVMQSSRLFTLDGAQWTGIDVSLMPGERIRDACRAPNGDDFIVSSADSSQWVLRRTSAGVERLRSMMGNDSRVSVGCATDGQALVQDMAVPGMEVTYGRARPWNDPERCSTPGRCRIVEGFSQRGIRRTSDGDTYFVTGRPIVWRAGAWDATAFALADWRGFSDVSGGLSIDRDGAHRLGVVAFEGAQVGTWNDRSASISTSVSGEDATTLTLITPTDGSPPRFGSSRSGALYVRNDRGQWAPVPEVPVLGRAQQVSPTVLWGIQGARPVRVETTADGTHATSQRALAEATSATDVVFESDSSGWIVDSAARTVSFWDGSTLTPFTMAGDFWTVISDRHGGVWVRLANDSALVHCDRTQCARSSVVLPGGWLQCAPDGTMWQVDPPSRYPTQPQRLIVVAPGGAPTQLLPGATFEQLSLFVASDGSAYIQSDRGLLRFRSATSAPERIETPTTASQIYATNTGDLWIRAATSGGIAHRAP